MATIKKVSETFGIQDTTLPSEDYAPKVMPRILTTWDMTITFVVAIFLATGATTAVAGGPAAITYLLLGGLTFFVPCLIATAQLGVMFTNEGALYNWTHKALGGYWSFFAGFCAWFPGVLIATSFAVLIVTYIQNMNSKWLVESWQQGLVIVANIAFTGVLSIQRFRVVQHVLNALACLTVLSSLLIGLSCIIWLLTGHASATNFSHWPDWGINPGNFTLFGLMVFAYIGTEGPLNMAGEVKEGQERILVKRHLLWGGLIIGALYIINTVSLLVVLGQNGTAPYALVTMVDKGLGKFFGNIVAVCLIASFLTSALVYNYVFARLLFVGAIDRRLPSALGRLNNNRVPANAIIFQTILGILFTLVAFVLAPLISGSENSADFSAKVYYVAQAAATLVWAISAAFLFIDLVGCYRHYQQILFQLRVLPLPLLWVCIAVGFISCIVAIVDTLLYSWIPQIENSQWWYLVGGLTVIFLAIAAVGSLIANSEANWQDMNA